MKRVVCVGGGPAGLYSAILFKKALPQARVEIYERNRPEDTFGWGVVFSDQTMLGFRDVDRDSHDAITDSFHHWDDIDVHFRGIKIRTSGHGFCGIERKRLLNILQRRAARLGVEQVFQCDMEDATVFEGADLVVAADGANSSVRRRHAAEFEPAIETRKCRFIWLGTRQRFEAFTFAFEQTEHGWFQIHAYQFSSELSTVIVETREETWNAHGLGHYDTAASIDFCQRLFARYLDGNALLSNARHLTGSAWLNFNRVLCRRWHHGNIVLIGDAAHTAHFGIGSGTKLAMEDAVALVKHVAPACDIAAGLESYQAERSVEALKLQSAARNRMEWFENVARYAQLEPWQFTYSLLTGSQRIGHDNLRSRDPKFVAAVEANLARQAGVPSARPPMFLPMSLRGLTLENRIIVSPMAQYKAVEGVPSDWHLVHYGSRASGGAGLIITEMTCVSAVGRITPGCTGLWNESQRAAWDRIVKFVHENSPAKICLQIGHSGRKGSTQLGWQQPDRPLSSGNWETLAPSPLPYFDEVGLVPREMTRADMDRVIGEFVVSTQFALALDFDMLELHMAHGYLLASFLSPLTNHRADEYGGTLSSRARFPLEVLTAVRRIWPAERPLSVRISACDWAKGGFDEDDLLALAGLLKAAGADVIDVSSGQTVAWQRPVYGRMWQTPFSDRIRNEVGIPTIAVGNIYESDHVNSIIAAGRADLCAIARPHLSDPSWTLHAAASQGYSAQWWPDPYLSGKTQLERQLARTGVSHGAV